jgi:pheromone shutdown protein TraB
VSERQSSESDWATQIVDGLEGFVGTVKSKTTEPVQKAAKYAVFGFMAVGVVFMVFFLLTILAIRVLDIFLPVWAAYVLLGGMFSALGLLVWSRRHARHPNS